MRIVADNEQEYKDLVRIQKVVTGLWKLEENEGLKGIFKSFMNTSIEKSYVKPGRSAAVANDHADMDTEDRELIVPYIVHAAIQKKKVTIQYKDAKGESSQRLIEPFSWRGDTVVAWCHERGAWRQFKPKQIVRIAVLDLPFDREEDVEIIAEHAKTMAHLAL